MRAPGLRRSAAWAAVSLGMLTSRHALADQPLTELKTWSGSVNFFATGAPMATDGPDSGTDVDQLAQPASVVVNSSEVPVGAKLLDAYLYWGGSILNSNCAGTTIDDTVDFTAPGGALSSVTADVCSCSDAGVTGYDVQLCRKAVTPLVGALDGTYVVDKFGALIANSSTNNASFSVVLVYESTVFKPRRIALWDGLLTMFETTNPTLTFNLNNLDVDNPPQGDLTWYVLEGDVGGTGVEQVSVKGLPSGVPLLLSDALNPVQNPMNHTINTTVPTQANSIGVDIDTFDVSAALASTDTSLEMTYQAGLDKFWIAYNIVGVNVYEPVFNGSTTKTWVLSDDADLDGEPSAGDTVRYTVHLENTGTAPGVVAVDDPIPAQAASFALVSGAGGVDASTASNLILTQIPVAAGASADVVFDVVLAAAPDNTVMSNTAAFDATPDGDMGTAAAIDVVIRRDGDADAVYDDDDNCPDVPNAGQDDGNGNGVGDACDPSTGGAGGFGGNGSGGGGATSNTATSGAGGSGGAGGSPSAGGNGGAPVTDTPPFDGCACTAPRRDVSSAWPFGLGLLAFAARRRRAQFGHSSRH